MTMPDSKDFGEDPMLDAFFDAGRAAAPQPSAALMARVLADAGEVQAAALEPVGPAVSAAPGRRFGPLGLLLAALGGWPSVAGLASAAVAGLWIGVAQPDMAAYVGLETASTDMTTTTETTGYDLSDIGIGGLVLAGEF